MDAQSQNLTLLSHMSFEMCQSVKVVIVWRTWYFFNIYIWIKWSVGLYHSKVTGFLQNIWEPDENWQTGGIFHTYLCFYKGLARTQTPTTINYAPESPTFGAIAKVSQTGVQW